MLRWIEEIVIAFNQVMLTMLVVTGSFGTTMMFWMMAELAANGSWWWIGWAWYIWPVVWGTASVLVLPSHIQMIANLGDRR